MNLPSVVVGEVEAPRPSRSDRVRGSHELVLDRLHPLELLASRTGLKYLYNRFGSSERGSCSVLRRAMRNGEDGEAVRTLLAVNVKAVEVEVVGDYGGSGDFEGLVGVGSEVE